VYFVRIIAYSVLNLTR